MIDPELLFFYFEPTVLPDFELFPDPIQNQLTISIAARASEVTIRVYDLQGKMIDLPTTLQNQRVQIITTSLHNGLYTLQITNNETGTSEVRKFVKQGMIR